jgi:pyruvate-ferredoxin/flavodoxin oxidoreductase
MYAENRFKMLTHSHPEAAKALLQQAQQDVETRWQLYEALAELGEMRGREGDGVMG